MTGVAVEDHSARGFALWLEKRERARSGDKLPVVRETLARRTGLLPGTFENLHRDRSKSGRKWIDILRAAVISEIEADIARAETELAALKRSHRSVDLRQVGEVEAGLAALRRIIRG